MFFALKMGLCIADYSSVVKSSQRNLISCIVLEIIRGNFLHCNLNFSKKFEKNFYHVFCIKNGPMHCRLFVCSEIQSKKFNSLYSSRNHSRKLFALQREFFEKVKKKFLSCFLH